MPKSSSKHRIHGTHKKSYLTAASPAATAASSSTGRHSYPSQVDDATWRVSRVPEDATVRTSTRTSRLKFVIYPHFSQISKTLALREYRLKPRDLDGLVFTKKRFVLLHRPHPYCIMTGCNTVSLFLGIGTTCFSTTNGRSSEGPRNAMAGRKGSTPSEHAPLRSFNPFLTSRVRPEFIKFGEASR